MNIEDQQMEQLLGEMRVLNNRKLAVKNELKGYRKQEQTLKDSIEHHAKQIKDLSPKIKKLRSSEASLKHIVNGLEQTIKQGEKELSNHGKETQGNLLTIENAKADLRLKEESLHKKQNQLKEERSKLDISKSELAIATRLNDGSLIRLKNEQESNANKLKISKKEREEFDTKVAKADALNDEIFKIKERHLQAVKEANAIITRHENVIKVLEEKQQRMDVTLSEVDELKEENEVLKTELEAKVLSNIKEKQAIEQAKKELNRDQLRFKKLLKEKELDKELAELEK